MATAITPLANLTVSGSTTTTVTFSSISGLYRDLMLVINGQNSADANMYLRFNGDSATNYFAVYLSGTGSSATSGTESNTGFFFNDNSRIGTENAMFTVNILDYTATDKHKVYSAGATRAGQGVERHIGRWANTSAITSISVNVASGNLVAGTTLALYGIAG
jgi:hypothetical protein